MKKIFRKLKDFDFTLKQNFTCFLCDFDSVKNWYTNDQFIAINYDVCENIVKNTFSETYFLNNVIYKYFNSVNLLSYCVDDKEDPFKSIENNKNIEFIVINNDLSTLQCKNAL